MIAFIIRRIIMALFVLILVTLFVFLAMRILPGDPIVMLLSLSQQQELSQEQINLLRHENGLDRPLMIQYISWIGGVFRGDLGKSIQYHTPVAGEIIRRLPITFHLGLAAFVIGIIIGVPIGVLCAVRRGSFIDTAATTLSNIGITMPSFWFGVMLIYLFGLYLKWFPIQGYTSPFDDFWLGTRQLIMPVVCLALFPIASMARQTRSSMLEVMSQDYIRTAWSKGLPERIIIIRHALKNGLIPVVTLAGMGLSTIIGGSVIIETVFNIPGMGRLAVSAINNHDYAYVQGIVLILAAVIMLANLLVDLMYGWLDPRIRYG